MIPGDFTIQLYSTKKNFNINTKKYEWTRVYTPLTSYEDGRSNVGGTYDENLSIKNNSQFSLTFSISKIVENNINPLFYLIVENRRLRLTTVDYIVDFIITGIAPQIMQNNVIYNVTCQDVFSYDWSKQNIKISYDSLEEFDEPLYINEHANNILERSKLGWTDSEGKHQGRYMIDPDLETKEFADFPNLLTTTMIQYTERTSSTLELTDATPLSAITELANKYGAILNITYPYANQNKDNPLTIISFKNQQLTSFKGLYIRPEANLNNFSVSRKTDNFCSILRVDGGEDVDGNLVSLMPEMPHEVEKFIIDLERVQGQNWHDWSNKTLIQQFYSYSNNESNKNEIQNSIEISNFFSVLERIVKSGGNILYNFDYYYNSGLISKKTLEELETIFSTTLRSSNLLTMAYSKQYNRLLSELTLLETEVEDYIASIAAEEEYQDSLKKEKELPLSGVDLSNYSSSENAIKDIEFSASNNSTSFLDKIWNRPSVYVDSGEVLFGRYFINNKIVELEEKKKKIENEYYNYLEEAFKLEVKYTKENGVVDWQDVKKQENENIEATYDSKNCNPDYIEYCYYTSQAENIYTFVGPFVSTPVFIKDKEFKIEVEKRGYYSIFIEELTKLLKYYHPSSVNPNIPDDNYINIVDNTRTKGFDDTSTLISNLLNNAKNKQDEIWKKLYSEYGDYICESSYSDTTQLSSDALYLIAQKEFTTRCNPSVDYSATIIDLYKILNVNNSKIDIGDIIYFYNDSLYNQYNGNFIIETTPISSVNRISIDQTLCCIPNMIVNANQNVASPAAFEITEGLIQGAKYTLKAQIARNLNDNTINPRLTLRLCYDDGSVDERWQSFNNEGSSYPKDGKEYLYVSSCSANKNKNLVKINGWVLDHSSGEGKDMSYRNAKINYTLEPTITNVETTTDVTKIFVQEEDREFASELVNSSLEIKIDDKDSFVVNKYLDMKPKPIQLQITGITKKLRDATTQLTISTNRMVENLLGKILRRSN